MEIDYKSLEGSYGRTMMAAYDRATIDPTLVRKLSDADFVSSVTTIKAVDAVVVRKVQA